MQGDESLDCDTIFFENALQHVRQAYKCFSCVIASTAIFWSANCMRERLKERSNDIRAQDWRKMYLSHKQCPGPFF